MKKLLLLTAMALLAASPAFAETASKDGTPIEVNPGTPNEPSLTRALFEYNTGGAIDVVPTLGGSATGWSEWAIAFVANGTGDDLLLTEISWPCGGPASGPYGWIIWTGTGGVLPGPASTADYFGPYTPDNPDGTTYPPLDYTYVDISASAIPFLAGDMICFGMDNTGMMGQVSYNGVTTWGWYGGIWDSDAPYGRTTVLQIKADLEGPVPADVNSWGQVKELFQ
ncbi:MAG: hypothetical protein KBD56_04095 [Candidatus Eisenbacteria bacterium]|nr:hypothetical protein [Candidatus Eisenbacteria bacterium]